MRLTIRAYNIGFGDCILISWDEADRAHHAWVDFGTHHNDDESSYQPAYDDILARTGGQLDLLLISHRHLDHLGGFYTLRSRIRNDFQVDRVWHAHVTPQVDAQFKIASDALTQLMPRELRSGSGVISRIYQNNLAFGTKDRMAAIEGIFPAGSVFQVHRQLDLLASGARPPGMTRMQVDVLAPEQDSAKYLVPIDVSFAARKALDDHFDRWDSARAAEMSSDATVEAEIGVGGPGASSAGAGASGSGAGVPGSEVAPDFLKLADFARLRRQLRSGGLDLLSAVNKSRNNTSIVSRWRWEGVTLLLTGDAELESWKLIRDSGADLSSTVLKIGHHGSIDASPTWSFDRVFPTKRGSNGILLSTNPLIFPTGNEVPKAEVVAGWTSRLRWPSRFRRTDAVPRGSAVEFVFDR